MNSQQNPADIRLPNRKKHSYCQSIQGAPGEVFPLLCPVRELDWAPGWNPDWVISRSGVAEQDCIFQTPGETSPAIWLISRHDPVNYRVEMYKVTAEHTVGKLEVELESDGSGGTKATVSYEFTSLGPAGDAFLEEISEEWYKNFMRNWERAMNHYLATGNLLNA
jgi:hypothetical protein